MKFPTRQSHIYEVLDEFDLGQHDLQANGSSQGQCYQRPDDAGFMNRVKAWHLYLWHIAACASLLLAIFRLVEGHEFRTGSPPWIFQVQEGLYQTQISGLVSLALVLIRVVVGSCTILLVWRIIFITLGKEGLKLSELTRLSNSRIPFLQFTSRRHFWWSACATLATILMWAPSFAAPLANSSIAWVPSVRLLNSKTTFDVDSVGSDADWMSIAYLDTRFHDVLHAAQMTSKDPAYAFNSSNLPLRRYFALFDDIPDKSLANLTVPYFDVKIDWIDAANDSRSSWIGNSTRTAVTDSTMQIRLNGSTQMFMDPVLNIADPGPDSATSFVGKKIIAVKVATWDRKDRLDDGSFVTNNSQCPDHAPSFGKLPNVSQYKIPYYWSGNSSDPFAGFDCFLLGEASIVAGQYRARDCVVNSAGLNTYTATCGTESDLDAVGGDWITTLALDHMSEVMKYSMILNITEPWVKNNLENHTSGLLTLAYHAAWSALTERLGKPVETADVQKTESVVRAVVDRTKLYAWLAMNVSLTVSALIVYLMQMSSTSKTIRDPTLAALTLDLTEVSHGRKARGLCNATSLQKSDEELSMLRWRPRNRKADSETLSFEERSCIRSVMLAGKQE